jgi:hypothetical protein
MMQIVKFIISFTEKKDLMFYLGTNISSIYTQLTEIEDGMSNLESTIKHLDTYSCLLENQVKKYL